MRNSKYILIYLFFFLFLAPSLSLALNPQLASYMKVEIIQKGGVEITGEIDSLDMEVAIPQSDEYQKIEKIEIIGPHDFITDNLGNKFVKFSWNKTKESADFEIKTIVSISRRDTASLPYIEEFLKPTPLIQSDEPDIIRLAESITLGEETDFGKIGATTKWVNENIKYDIAYADVNNSAKKTLELKAGVCDEFSNLLIAISRALGYRSAYVVGYAYGRGYREAEDFVPHGWTEICYGGTCYPADPTWAEAGFIDASHIKFARLSDNFFPETSANAKGRKGSSIKIKPSDIKIRIIEQKEEPVLKTKSELLEKEIWNGHAVLKTSLEAHGCILTKIKSSACEMDGKEFLEAQNPEEVVYFCGQRNLFSVFKIPELQENIRYACQVSALPFFGKQTNDTVSLAFSKKNTEELEMNIDKTSLYPGEDFNIESAGSHIFTDYGDYAKDKAAFKAQSSDFKVYAYKQGLLKEQEIKVVKEKPFEIELAIPENTTAGEPAKIGIIITSKSLKEQELEVKLKELEEKVKIKPMQTETLYLNFTASDINDNIVQVFAFGKDFSTSISKRINVIESEKSFIEEIGEIKIEDINILEKIIEIISNIFKSILSVLR